MPALAGTYAGYYRASVARPQTSPLALAAAGARTPTNPFGFQGVKNTAGYRAPSPTAPLPSTQPAVTPAPAGKTAANTPVISPVAPKALPAPSPAASSLPQYDINTDPALQQTRALTGESDQQATADANAQRAAALIAYGDPKLAQAVLGDSNVAASAAGNPNSTVAQLGQQFGRNENQLTEALNANNLLYSGYRVQQEQQAEQDYQNALANAAGQVQGGLNTISGNLASALASNQQQREQALADAANRAMQAPQANGTGASSSIAQTLVGEGRNANPAATQAVGTVGPRTDQTNLIPSYLVEYPSSASYGGTQPLTSRQVAARNKRQALV
jgi:hypothetical protein